jgi:phospholipid/cholesterol/gamma-HCH transport system substrate-binding protein
MKNTLETRLGLFVAVAAVAAFFIVEVLGVTDLFKPSLHLRAQFNNIDELKVGDPVKMAGVPVGRVEEVKLATNKVDVELRLNRGTPVHTDSKATVRFAGLMGQNYISIDFGSADAPLLEPNQTISTMEQPDLNSLMTKLDDVATGVQNLTKSFTGDKIDNLLGPFTDFMKENNPRLSAILANMQSITTQVKSGQGSVGKMIYDDQLYNAAYASVTNLQSTADQIKLTVVDARGIVTQAKSIMGDVQAGKGTVGKLLEDPALYNQTTAMMTNARSIMEKINTGQGSVGKLIKDQEFYKNAKLSLQKLDKATEGLEDEGPLSILGTLSSHFF